MFLDKYKQSDQVHDRNTRSNEDLDIPKFRTCTGQRTFKYRGTKLWNKLDKETKLITNLNSSRLTDLMKKH
jgi:hypothetical protein